jgi:hypothetical protein
MRMFRDGKMYKGILGMLIFSTLGADGNSLNSIKGMSKQSTANITLNSETLILSP